MKTQFFLTNVDGPERRKASAPQVSRVIAGSQANVLAVPRRKRPTPKLAEIHWWLLFSSVLILQPTEAEETVSKRETLPMLRRMAQEEQPRAHAILASVHRWGEFGQLQNAELASQFVQSAVELGSPLGAVEVLAFEQASQEVKRKAEEVLKQGLPRLKEQSEKGDARSTLALMLVYQRSLLGQKNSTDAMRWLNLAAKELPTAAFFLALGIETRTPNPQEHRQRLQELYTFAANGDLGLAALRLAEAHRSGDIADRSAAKSRAWCLRAAELNSVEAKTLAGWMLLEGYGGPKDLTKGLQYYREAATLGNPQACFDLGVAYENGEGVGKSLELAAEWYSKAALKGHAKAQCNLGWMHHEGVVLEKNLKKAETWYRRASRDGDATAQCNLACLLIENGTPNDLPEAKILLEAAAKQGEQRAIGLLTQMRILAAHQQIDEDELRYQIEVQTELEMEERAFRKRFGR